MVGANTPAISSFRERQDAEKCLAFLIFFKKYFYFNKKCDMIMFEVKYYMKLVLDIKGKKALKPSKDDILIFDGNYYYITTKEDILSESLSLLRKSQEELKAIKEENEKFKKEVAGQLMQMSDLIKNLYSK